MKLRTLIALPAALLLLVSACTTGGESTTTAEGAATTGGAVTQRDYRFVVVSHGQSSDPFWSVAANGANDAADDMGVTVEYQAPGTFDMAAMAQLINAAVASAPDGLVDDPRRRRAGPSDPGGC